MKKMKCRQTLRMKSTNGLLSVIIRTFFSYFISINFWYWYKCSYSIGRIGHAPGLPAEKAGARFRAAANDQLRARFAAVPAPFGDRKFQAVEIHSNSNVEKVRQYHGLFHRVNIVIVAKNACETYYIFTGSVLNTSIKLPRK